MYTRRSFLRSSLTAAAGAISGLPGLARGSASARSSGERRHVLLILVDDLNDWIGCLGGHPDARTPNIDALAAQGVCFTRAYCNAPACNPSRASLFTGMRPSTSGVYDNRQPFRWALPEAVTLQQHLMAQGYEVIGRGKIFHGRYPDPASWHEYIPKGPKPLPPERPLNGMPNARHFDWGPVDVPDDEMDDTKVVRWCAEQLGRKRDKPLFLACGLNTPHLPWYVPRRYLEMFPPEQITLPTVAAHDLDDVPPEGRAFVHLRTHHERIVRTRNWRGAVAAYLASVAFTDRTIGRLMEALDASPHRDDTLILFLGDQGWHLGEKLHWRSFALWEEATRVPLVFSGPGLRGAGMPCGRTVSFIDVFPTLCDLLGLPRRPELEGASLRPLLEDPATRWDRPALTTHGRSNHSVRSERWRYIRYHGGSEELYDHDSDELEWTNLAKREELGGVRRRLAAWLPETDAPDARRDDRG